METVDEANLRIFIINLNNTGARLVRKGEPGRATAIFRKAVSVAGNALRAEKERTNRSPSGHQSSDCDNATLSAPAAPGGILQWWQVDRNTSGRRHQVDTYGPEPTEQGQELALELEEEEDATGQSAVSITDIMISFLHLSGDKMTRICHHRNGLDDFESLSCPPVLGGIILGRRDSEDLTFNQIIVTLIFNLAAVCHLTCLPLGEAQNEPDGSPCFNRVKARKALKLYALFVSILVNDEDGDGRVVKRSSSGDVISAIGDLLLLAGLYNISRIHRALGMQPKATQYSQHMLALYILLRETNELEGCLNRTIKDAVQTVAAELVLRKSISAPSA